jgi:hypothetical protein
MRMMVSSPKGHIESADMTFSRGADGMQDSG